MTSSAAVRAHRVHPAWWVAGVTFLALVGAAGFRAVPGVLIDPLRAEFGWSTGTVSAAVAVNLALYGLTAPFAAALMERFGIRRVVVAALVVVAAGSGLTVFMSTRWQLVLLWGVLVGLGTGSMAFALVATVVGRWFVARRGLVSGVLTAGGATGQLIFLPVVAVVAENSGWRTVGFIVFYGLDWVATIPPTMALCRDVYGAAPVVFGWVFAAHQVGAALMALAAGLARDVSGSYDGAWYAGGVLCLVAGGLSLLIRRDRDGDRPIPVSPTVRSHESDAAIARSDPSVPERRRAGPVHRPGTCPQAPEVGPRRQPLGRTLEHMTTIGSGLHGTHVRTEPATMLRRYGVRRAIREETLRPLRPRVLVETIPRRTGRSARRTAARSTDPTRPGPICGSHRVRRLRGPRRSPAPTGPATAGSAIARADGPATAGSATARVDRRPPDGRRPARADAAGPSLRDAFARRGHPW